MKKGIMIFGCIVVVIVAAVLIFSSSGHPADIIEMYKLENYKTVIKGMPVGELNDRDGILSDFIDDGKCIIVGGISGDKSYKGKNLLIVSTYSSSSRRETLIEIKDADFRDYSHFFDDDCDTEYTIIHRHS